MLTFTDLQYWLLLLVCHSCSDHQDSGAVQVACDDNVVFGNSRRRSHDPFSPAFSRDRFRGDVSDLHRLRGRLFDHMRGDGCDVSPASLKTDKIPLP